MKKYFILLSVIVLSVNLFSQVQKKIYHPFTGTIVLSMEGGTTYGITDYEKYKFDVLGRGMIEYFLPTYSKGTLGFRLFGGMGFLKGEDQSRKPNEFRTDLKFIGGGLVYNLSINETFFPYFFGGVSYLWFDPKGPDGNLMINRLAYNYKAHELDYNGELGCRILVTDNLSFNINFGVSLSPTDNLDDIAYGTSKDMFFTSAAGFSFAFLGEGDSDLDGVLDSKDLCPETPLGIKVDQFGCPFDSDKDGVPDYLDECPDTPQGVKVDKHGCPLDTDGDGIYDYLDICPNTPKGVKVDEFGCPLDSDNDGVPDYMDKCPNTPIEAKVDKFGCPLDSDNDGVPDYLDQCPNTAPGEMVDKFGCTIKKEEPPPPPPPVIIKEVVLSAGTTFVSGKADLLPSAYPELDKLVKVMKEEPNTRWLIEGHTDNIGKPAVNKKLSLQRATSVLNYFISKGIFKSRFEVRGLGSAFPIADNKTEEGRQKNRRVKIMRLN